MSCVYSQNYAHTIVFFTIEIVNVIACVVTDCSFEINKYPGYVFTRILKQSADEQHLQQVVNPILVALIFRQTIFYLISIIIVVLLC